MSNNRQPNKAMPAPMPALKQENKEQPEVNPVDLLDAAPAVVEVEKAVDTPVEPAKIMVVAKMNGYYKRCRKSEGDVFEISSMNDLGDWMKCLDPKLEKIHLEMIKARKAGL